MLHTMFKRQSVRTCVCVCVRARARARVQHGSEAESRTKCGVKQTPGATLNESLTESGLTRGISGRRRFGFIYTIWFIQMPILVLIARTIPTYMQAKTLFGTERCLNPKP